MLLGYDMAIDTDIDTDMDMDIDIDRRCQNKEIVHSFGYMRDVVAIEMSMIRLPRLETKSGSLLT